jgi:hypothetical protein
MGGHVLLSRRMAMRLLSLLREYTLQVYQISDSPREGLDFSVGDVV